MLTSGKNLWCLPLKEIRISKLHETYPLHVSWGFRKMLSMRYLGMLSAYYTFTLLEYAVKCHELSKDVICALFGDCCSFS